MTNAKQSFRYFAKILLLIITTLSFLLVTLDLGFRVVHCLIHNCQFAWNVEYLFSVSVLAFGLMNLTAWKGVDRYGLGNIFKVVVLLAIIVLVLISSFPPREEEYSIARCNMPASCIRPVSEDKVLPWLGKHYGFPIDFLHIYDQSNGEGLCINFDPHWLFVDWTLVLIPFYAIALSVFEIKRRR